MIIIFSATIWDGKDYIPKQFPPLEIEPDFSLSVWKTPSNYDENRLPKSTIRHNGQKYWSDEIPDDLKNRFNLANL